MNQRRLLPTDSDLAHADGPTTSGFLRSIDWVWASVAMLGAFLLLLSAFLPLWVMELKAPQYPQGLELTAYGTRMEGDLSEINILNHYVGIRPIEPDSVRELALFPFALGAIIALLLFAGFKPRWHRLPVRWMATAGVWLFPIGFLVDLQWWLYDSGHNLNETAAIRIEEFTPKVIGTTRILNFQTETMVSWGWWCMAAAALLATFGPITIRFLRDAWANTAELPSGTKTALGIFLAPIIVMGAPGGNQSQAPTSVNGYSIMAAIDAASPGDTVVVPPGFYNEQLVIEKSITLIGEGMPVIDGGGLGNVVEIRAENVTFRGFIVQNTSMARSQEPTGILIVADGALIEDNIVRDVLYGIYLKGSHNHVIRGNTISSLVDFPPQLRGHGLYLWNTMHNVIEENIVHDAKDGIFLGFTYFTEIRRNELSGLRFGIHYMYADDNSIKENIITLSEAGAVIMYSRRVTVEGNVFSYASGASAFGMLLKDVDDLTIRANLIHHNRLGIVMEGAPLQPESFVRLEQNLIAYNQIALELSTTTDAEFSGNNFTGNLRQVRPTGGDISGKNTWSINGRGNYWDDYVGYDTDGDGIGDLPYRNEGTFESLIEKNEALRAFQYTFAQSTLDLTARWFPLYEAEPRITDPAPLMKPTISLNSDAGGSAVFKTIAIAALLMSAPLTIALLARRSLQLEAQPC